MKILLITAFKPAEKQNIAEQWVQLNINNIVYTTCVLQTGALKKDIIYSLRPNPVAWSIRRSQDWSGLSKGNSNSKALFCMYTTEPLLLTCWHHCETFCSAFHIHTFSSRAPLLLQCLSRSSHCWPLTSGKWVKCQENRLYLYNLSQGVITKLRD